MKGLIKNNFYGAAVGVKFICGAVILFGTWVVYAGSQQLLIAYSLLCFVLFPINAMAALREEGTSKWVKYKLTAPVRRQEIVKSYYISQFIWILAGVLPVSVSIPLSIIFHGPLFDRYVDILMIYTVGIGITLFMGAVYYPLHFFLGEERSVAVLSISLVCAGGILAAMIFLINFILGPNMELPQILLSAAVMLASAFAAYSASLAIAIRVFQRAEF